MTKRRRLMSQYGLSAYDATVLVIEGAQADFFEAAVVGRDPKLTANWVTNELLGHLAKDGLEITESPIPAADIAGLVELIETDVISSKIAREVFEHMWAGEGAPADIVKARGMGQVSDTGALEAMIDKLIAANPGQAEQVKTKPQAIGWFVGQVMRQTGGQGQSGER